jgi:hypothetical protein
MHTIELASREPEEYLTATCPPQLAPVRSSIVTVDSFSGIGTLLCLSMGKQFDIYKGTEFHFSANFVPIFFRFDVRALKPCLK